MNFSNYDLESSFFIEYPASQFEINTTNRISLSDSSTISSNSNKPTKINILYNNNCIKKKQSKIIYKKNNNKNNKNNNNNNYDKIYNKNNNKILKNNNNNNIKNIYNNEIINNWYIVFQKYKFIYQLILDKNTKIFNILNLLSIFLTTLLGIFSAFKMSAYTDNNLSVTTNFVKAGTACIMCLEFFTAFIIALSKKYSNNSRTNEIKQYIFHLNIFIGEIYAQLLNSNIYKDNANKFIKLHINKYTKLIIRKPLLSINENNYCEKEYQKYISNHC